jgi:hypothetical protein
MGPCTPEQFYSSRDLYVGSLPNGLAADGTYAAGVRRTFEMTAEDAWSNWSGPTGLARWLSGYKLRVLSTARDVTVALHLERLPDAATRAEMMERWTRVLEGGADKAPAPKKVAKGKRPASKAAGGKAPARKSRASRPAARKALRS